jgi:hypothetical protein
LLVTGSPFDTGGLVIQEILRSTEVETVPSRVQIASSWTSQSSQRAPQSKACAPPTGDNRSDAVDIRIIATISHTATIDPPRPSISSLISCTSLLKSNRLHIQSLKMADGGHVEEPKNFAPKTPVNLDPPKDDPISYEELSKCDGTAPSPTHLGG